MRTDGTTLTLWKENQSRPISAGPTQSGHAATHGVTHTPPEAPRRRFPAAGMFYGPVRTAPGFMMPSGSSAALIARIAASLPGSP